MTKISYFPKLVDSKTSQVLDLNTVLEGIKQGKTLKPIIDKIRSTESKEERDELKKTLPLVTFGGVFSERKASALKEYSHLICLDFDDLGENLETFREQLKEDAHVMAVWKSPAGEGLKCLIKVSSNNHLSHAMALLKEYPEADANAIKDVNRACFLSYDENLHYNPKAEVYTKIVESVHNDQQKYEKLKKWMETRGEAFVTGNRNSFIAKLSGAMNRFGISEDFAAISIEKDFCSDSSFSVREAKGVIRSMYGNYQDQFNTASFDDAMSDTEVTNILSGSIEIKDIITVGDLREDLDDAFDNGIKGGETTYYPGLDEHFKWMRNEMTLISGISNMGKSAILSQLLINKAVFEGKKFALFSPEQAPPILFFMDFVRTLVGKPLEKGDPNRMSKVEYNRALDFIHEHFMYIYPEKEEPTPDYIHARFMEAKIKHGIDGTVIDPFASMSNDWNTRDDKYLEKFLNKSQRFAIQNELYYIIVTHPKNMNKKSDGTFECPDLFDLANGSTWSKRMDNILIYHRPNFPVDRSSPECLFKSIKIKKQFLNGKPGEVSMQYDWKRGRFYMNNFCPLDKFTL
jgi:hypothetical protein